MADGELSGNPKDKKRSAHFTNKPGLFSGVHRCIFAMKDVVALTHGPPGCNFACKTICGELYLPPYMNTTGPNVLWDESSLIFGNEKNLEEAILEVNQRYKPRGIFVLGTNTSGTIGEDIQGIVSRVRAGLEIPVLALTESVDFVTLDQEKGECLPLLAVIDELMHPPSEVYDRTVNLMLCVDWKTIGPQGNLSEFKRLVEKVGIGVNLIIPVGCSLGDLIHKAPRAALNVLFTENHEPVTEAMKKKFGTPYVKVWEPFGLRVTREALLAVADSFGMKERALEVIDEEEKAALEAVKGYIPFIKGLKAGVQNYGCRASMQALALRELGLDVEVIVLREPTESSLLQIKRVCEWGDMDPEVFIYPSLLELEEILDRYNLDIIFGAWEGTAPPLVRKKAGCYYSSESKAEALWGYRGFVRMARDVAHLISYGFDYRFKKYLKGRG